MDKEQKLRDYLKRASADLKRSRQRVSELEAAATEPIAIVGMSCRYPGGVSSPEELWTMLVDGRDGITAMPDDRGWEAAVGEASADFAGGFLHDAPAFDPDFFGISPREALSMDPQQRLLLETGWEAFERAGIDPAGIRGSRTGMFVGAMPQDYRVGPEDDVQGFQLTGNATSILSGRLSYFFGAVGPAVTVDTACSSSLVALHLAAQSLRAGECSLALAAGVTVMASPTTFVEFARQGGLAGDGRCKSFADAADGTGWSEGVGVLVLERLSEARRNGHHVLAVVRGSAVNQDGASNGLTAPNGPSQQRVIESALVNARLTGADVDAVEAHGTGTVLGDPVEAQALLATYGQGRDPERPLLLGSVKSNISHTQAAAGVAGIIKMVMAMRHDLLPRTLHVDRPSTHVDWTEGAVRLLTDAAPWPRREGAPRRAGVSSFGLSGTNAHTIIEEAPAEAPATEPADAPPAVEPGALPWLLSGRTPDALRAQAARLLDHLTGRPELPALDVSHALATTRSALEHRAALTTADRDTAVAALTALAGDTDAADIPGLTVHQLRGRTKLAVLFSGQGSQRPGMGRELYARFPVFAAALDEILGHLDAGLDRPLRDLMFAEPDSAEAALLDRTGYAQPALFALEVALYRLVESWGVTPDHVTGHSVGEIAAAHVAGVFSLADACALVVARGSLMQALPEGGAMVSLEATEDEVAPLLAAHQGQVSVAAVNGPSAVVVAGAETAVEDIAAHLAALGRRTRRLKVSHAFHSPLMEPMLAEFRAVVARLAPQAPTLPVVSNLTGAPATVEQLTSADYWTDHVRRPVRFADGISYLAGHGTGVFLELGPDATLAALTRTVLDAGSHQGAAVLPALRKDRPEAATLTETATGLHLRGTAVRWQRWFDGTGAHRADLPTYAFQHRRFWPKAVTGLTGDMRSAGLGAAHHPLLAAAVTLANSDGTLLTGRLSVRTHPWLADHAVRGTVLLAGTAFLELAVRAGDEVGCDRVEDLTLAAPLALPEDGGVQVQVWIGSPDETGRRALSLYSRPDGDDDTPWTQHAEGTLATGAHGRPDDTDAFAAVWPPAGAEPVDLDGFYDGLADAGFAYGPAFRGLRAVWRRGEDTFAEIALDAGPAADAAQFGLHPALLDAALHATALAPLGEDARGGLPFAWQDVTLHAGGAAEARVRITPAGDDAVTLAVADTTGAPVASIGSLVLRSAPDARAAATALERDALFALDWTRLPGSADTTDTTAPTAVGLLGDDPYGLGAALTAAGVTVGGDAPDVVLAPVTGGEDDVPAAVHTLTARVLGLLQEWLAGDRPAATRLVVVTRGAVAADGSALTDPAAAAVWGLVRAAQAEHPHRFGLVDLDPADPDPVGLLAALAAEEPQTAVRAGTVLAARLTRVRPDGDRAATAWDPEGTVVITGGTGGLGAVLARHLVTEHGVRHLLLAGRRGPDAPGATELAAALRESGADVTVTACDVAEPDAVARLFAAVPAEHPVTAVVHTAGTLDDGLVESLTPERLTTVLRPKADAVWHLHQATRGLDLAAFVVFSSLAGTTGAPGQANYAAGNAFLDAVARLRRDAGLPGLSLGWGPWAPTGGMTGDLSARDLERMERSGTPPLTTAQGLALFDAALGLPRAAVLPVRLDLAALRGRGEVPPLLRGLVRGRARRTVRTGSEAALGLAQRLARLDEEARADAVVELVRAQTAGVLGHASATDIDPERPFQDLGFDSLTAVELRNRLAAATGLRTSATVIFDYPTVAALAAHLLEELSDTPEPAAPAAAPQSRATADDPIVIVGMSCRYPGGVSSPDDLWRLVTEGTDAIGGLPVNRGWDLDGLYHPDPDHPGTSYTRYGGFLHDAGEFDAQFFGMSPREALATDSQQRLLLEASWTAVEHAGIDPVALRGSQTGVFAGVMYSDYSATLADERFEGHQGSGTAPSIASGRVSYALGLEGPAVTVDTACSSSLVAMHWAMQALRAGECSLALAGGVTVMSTPTSLIEFSRQRGLSPDGRCKAFSDDADGVGWSEGVGMLVLERLSDARRNGHRVLAVVRGSAVNQDGASNGLTAPNGPSQQRVIRQALASAGLTTSDVDAVEAHGTGTPLGDPIEAQALLATYGQDRPAERPLLLGSVKSNLGHTQAAAGVAGVIKMVMAMRHGQLPRTLHADQPSRHVDWESGDVTLLRDHTAWPETGRPRRAAVSSFGISGTNAHLVLEQGEPARPAAPRPATPTALPWTLSGRTRPALRAQAARLLGHLDTHPSAAADLTLSLATTRPAFEQRAVVVGTPDDARRALAALAADRPDPALVLGETGGAGRTAFLFTGQGSQRPGTGRALYERHPVFAEALDEVIARLDPLLVDAPAGTPHGSLKDVLFAAEGTPGATALHETGWTQPALFALETAAYRLVRSWGVRPGVFLGHSVGSVAAAHAAGILSLDDACALVAARARLMQALPEGGVMWSLQATEDEVTPLLAGQEDHVGLAAVNGPDAVVVSGDQEAADRIAAHFADLGRTTRRLRVSHAFHSPRMDAMLDAFREVAESLTYHEPTVPVVSDLTGRLAEGDDLRTADHWVRHVRSTVRFADAVRAAHAAGAATYLELGPGGSLCAAAQDTLGDDTGADAVPLLRTDRPEDEAALTALARLHVRGVRVDWTAVHHGTGATTVELPTYAFQHQTYWPDTSAPTARRAGGPADPADAALWSAVESGDAASLAGLLGLRDEEHASLYALLPSLSSWRRARHERAVLDAARYRVGWQPAAAEGAPVLDGTWLAVTTDGAGSDVLDALRGHGAVVERLDLDATHRDRDHLAEALRGAAPDGVSGVISLLPLADPARPGTTLPAGFALGVVLAQALADNGSTAPLWTVTRGAVSTGADDPLTHPARAAAWGLGRVTALERPAQFSGLVDLPEQLDAPTVQRLVSVLATREGEDQLAVRAGGTLARRIVRHPGDDLPREDAFTASGTVLITGGTGGLGARTARWLARAGAAHLILTSRRGPDAPGAAELRAELEESGARVTVVACDSADRDALAAVLAAVPDDAPLTGVVHAAGVGQAAPLTATPLDDVAAAMAAKTLGAAHLDALLDGHDLDFFVLVSSVAGVWGSAGQSAYAAANAYLDALAEHRHARGLPATSVAWGPWAEIGMASAHQAVSDGFERTGLRLLDPDTAMAELRRAVVRGESAVTVADVDWEQYHPVFTAARASRLFDAVDSVAALAAPAAGTAAATSELAVRLGALTGDEQERLLTDLVRSEAAVVLGHTSADGVPAKRAFRDAGFDSLTAVDLRKRLVALTGLALPTTLVFDYPNPVALARHLRGELLGTAEQPALAPAAPAATDEPIAIIGMSCRFPGGARSADAFWRLVADSTDTISDFPVNRGWDADALYDPDPDRPGTTYSTQGGFLHDAGEFDAGFFGISPREAVSMDPQQRLLLETTWEAFEHAGIDPASVHSTPTGTFIGSTYQDYGVSMDDGSAGHAVTGSSPSVLSGRLAYSFGLEGPAVTVDTACSSSLVALHLACQSLRNGESTLALAGGATVMTNPMPFIAFSRQRALARDGRCKAFSDGADGMTLAEGIGILVLEKLSDARRNGHEVLAVVRGSAINQDGASNGLTAPNGPSQVRVIRQALGAAGLTTADVDVVEAHGTGTALGDPIEAQALLATYGQGRDPEHPLLLGSVKSNIGHTQSAAGVAGIIKMVMAMRHGQLPRTLHADQPSRHIDWSSGTVRLITEPTAWHHEDRPLRCAVSSFGISGTNAHAVLEQAPAVEEPAPAAEPRLPAGGTLPWILSAAAPAALRDQAAHLATHLTAAAPHPADVGHTLITARSVLEHRAVALGAGPAELTDALTAFAGSAATAQVVHGTADTDGRTVFVFPGQGSQWAGMGAELLDTQPVFAERFHECAAALAAYTDWSLVDVVRQTEGAPTLDRVDVVQPATWAVMVSLAELWRAHGVTPDAVIGHSQGEIAAAVVSGALSLADGARVVALRSQAIGRVLAGAGGMMSVQLSAAEAEEHLAPHDGAVCVAAVNGPRSVVLAGTPDALDALQAEFTARDVRARRVAVDYASHSAQVERLEAELLDVLAPVAPRAARVPFHSTVTGELLDTTGLDAAYWYRNLRQSVRFDDTVRSLLATEHTVFVEISPHPVLTMAVQATAEDTGRPVAAVGTLRRDQGSTLRFLTSLAEQWVRGGRADWNAVYAGTGARKTPLPTYAFQREHLWAVAGRPQGTGAGDPADAEFWAEVEQQDVDSLASRLRLDRDALAPLLPALSTWRKQRRDRSTVGSWRYRATWKPLGALPAAALDGSWLLVTADGTDPAHTDAVTDALTAHGATALPFTLTAADTDRAALAERLRALPPLTGVVSLLADAETTGTVHPVLTDGLALSVLLVQALGDAGTDAPVWALTRGAVSTGRADRLTRPAQAMVHGLGWTAALEHPDRWGGTVDLPETLDARTGERLAAVLAGTTGEDQLAVRPGGVLARRITPAPAPTGGDWTPRGTVLVTGGTGTLGPHLARWLADQGATDLVLTSRRGPDAPGAADLVAELAARDCRVTVAACDVADRDAVAALLDGIAAEGRTVRSVFHTAAVIELQSLDETSLDAFAKVVHAKTAGALHLDELLDDDQLDAFVLYSSTAGMWGSGRHAAYVAANAHLNALAEHRRARGAHGTAVSWGIWADDMKLGRVDPGQIRRSGLEFMDPKLALAALRQVLDGDEGALAVADVDWDRYHPVFTSSRPTDLFEEVPEVRALTEESAARAAEGGEFTARLRALPAGEQDRLLLDLVRSEAATVLGHASPEVLSERRAFRDVGFDSLTAVDLRNRLAAVTGLTLPSTMVFDYPDPLTLVGFLRGLIGGPAADTGGPVRTAAAVDDDPIAVVAMSCRYPGGVTSPEALWDLVSAGADAITGFPADRGWDADALYDPDPDRPGTTYSTQGGFLHDVADFDAGFFGISPREALAMDPQQRLLLETGWEVMERAGIDPQTLRSSLTGTFIGASYQDYSAGGASSEGAEGHLITGTISSVMSGRLAYTFGFEGPAVTLDTACSSSLVALHLACQSLRNGESTLALAGGVSVMATPQAFTGFSRQRAMAPDGRCKAYAEGADGMSLAEGVGLVLVERLSDARRNGHPVLAVIRGSAVNQDGASNGLTAPNGPSQARVIRQALANAGLTAADVDVVEGHGTGTALGDPIEAQALLATYGQDRPAERPLLLGSVKSNIGHTQMASGIAGVMKMVMAMRHGTVPRTLHIDTPSSHVDWTAGAITLATDTVPWPETGRPHRAGISSFGLSGTNVHTIVEQAEPEPEPATVAAADPDTLPDGVPVVLSARTATALRDQAGRLLTHLTDHPALPLTDLAASLAGSRAALEHRAAVLPEDREGLLRALTALRDDRPDTTLLTGAPARGRLAFLFTGQGSQRAAMGRELYARHPEFADALDAVLTHFDQELDRPLRDVLFAEDGTPEAGLLHDTAYTQPALFALEVALYRLVESWGVRPDSVAGHSIGEIAAAHVAGVFSLADACTLVAARGRLMAALPAGGAMIAVEATEDEVLPLLEGLEDQVSLAAVNGPRAVVVAGDAEPVALVAALLAEDGRRTRALRVSHAFHSPRMDAMLDDFARVARELTYQAPLLAVVSTVTGDLATAADLTSPAYWVDQVRATVRFADAVRTLHRQGVTSYLELGPDGTLSAAARTVLDDLANPDDPANTGGAATVTAVPALRRDRAEVPSLAAAVARLHVHGTPVDWSATLRGTGARRVDLPTYAFQRSRYWPDTTATPPTATGPAETGTDAAFWAAVERADLPALGADLGLDDTTVAALVPALSSWRRRRTERATADSRRHRVLWKPLDGAPTARPDGTWLVLRPTTPAPGATALLDTLGLTTTDVTADTTDRAALAAALRELPRPDGGFTGVLALLALTGTDHDDDPAGTAALAPTATALTALDDAGITAPVWIVTRQAVSTGRADRLTHPGQAALWGLGRAAALEQPGRRIALADLPEQIDDRTVRRLAHLLAAPGDETQLAVRASATYARRLAHHPAPQQPARPFAPEGTALITGGTGALGAHVARRLAGRGTPHLLLVSRRGPDAPGAAELAAELRESGAEVTVAACDTADRDALAALLATVPDTHPLTAVVHAAGVLDDGLLDALTPERFATVLDAKARSAAHLHDLTRDLGLTDFVLFSSTAGALGAAGQANYAAANAYLDALAEHRRDHGLPATSVAWGPWSGTGMAGDHTGVEDRVRRGGYTPMSPDDALAALDTAVGHGDTALVVADIDWQRYATVFAPHRALVADLPELRATAAAATTPGDTEPVLRRQVAALTGPARERYVLDFLRAQVAAVLGHPDPDAVEPDRAFTDLGFDSLTTVELRNTLSATTGLRLPATLVYDFPTARDLAAHLLTEILGTLPEPTAGTTDGTGRATDDDPVVVVGMGCRFPGGVESPDDLWRLLDEGRDAVSGFPTDRGWDLDALARGGSATLEGGFLDGAGRFDAAFFGISPREALAMDPQQRLLLETTWEALERSGIDPQRLRGSATGVFVGTNGQDYATMLRRGTTDVRGHAATGTTASVMSGRLSYTLGLEGPAVTVDTACSSALVALHMGAGALRSGECSLVLAGGVSVMASPDAFVEFTAQGGLAGDGRCKAFADSADGTAWSEGAGVLVLERLSDARRNGHPVLAVLSGSAVNQDGASNGLTAPNGRAQQRVIRQALADARLTPADVDAVEAHGTGTTLGDPIEAHALIAAYGQGRPEDRPLLLGTVKSNLGHTQAAAGAAGVIKTVLALGRDHLPRTLHVDAPTSHVDWSAGTVELLREQRAWPETGRPRRAGVSAFGVSGTNAHVILEQPAPATEPAAPEATGPAPAVLPWLLSARSEQALTAQADRLDAFTAARPQVPALDTAYSLATGRSAFAHRAALLVTPEGEPVETVRDRATDRRLAVLFSGQGAQRAGMGRELYGRFPVFAEALDAVLARLDVPELREVLFAEDDERLHTTGHTQPALFAVEVALYRLVESWGVAPEFVAGHSIGEIAAAHVAGVFSLDDACTLVAARARLMQELPSGGAMVAVQATEAEIAGRLTDGVSLAAVNAPDSVVIAGEEAEVLALTAEFAAEGRKTQRLAVSHAFHSALMEPMLDAFREVAEGLTYAEPRIPVVSNVTGALAAPGQLTTPAYWVEHVRGTVRFADGVRALADAGADAFLEVGPHGVLTGMAARVLDDGAVSVPALRKDRGEETALLTALARLHTAGVPVDWAAWFTGTGARRTELPTYAFQRELYWPEPASATDTGQDPVDAAFWAAVEREDLESLATTLDLDDALLSSVLPALSTWRRGRSERTLLDGWRYRVTWQPVTLTAATTATGPWLVLTRGALDGDPWTEALASALGTDAIRLALPDGTDGTDRAVAALRAATADGTAYAGVLSLRAAGPDTLLRLLADAGIDAPLWCVTRGAVTVGRADRAADPEQAAVWGLGRVIALEEPTRWGGLVDVDQVADARTAERLRAVLNQAATDAPAEDQVALRASGVHGRRLTRAAARQPGADWRPTGAVLVTGGPEGFGGQVARWLAARGATEVLLAGPDAPGDALDALRADVETAGAALTVVRHDDPADPAPLTEALAALPADRPLTAVVHTGDTSDGNDAGGADASDPSGLLSRAAHVRSAYDALTVAVGDAVLDAFVVFGSISAVWGVSGQGAGAAAGACLDALVQEHRARGTNAVSVSWGAWQGAGPDGLAAHLRANGLPAMAPDRALAALAAVTGEAAQDPAADASVTVADVAWDRFAPAFTLTRPGPLFTALPEARDALRTAGGEGGDTTAAARLRDRLRPSDPADRVRALLDLVLADVASVLGHADAGAVPAELAFKDLGFDSLTAVDLRNRLAASTGLTLPATLVFDYPTPAVLAGHLLAELLGADAESAAAPVRGG
ncbi:type I polyketide synthase, partial [Streptomyces griseoviridis]